MIILKLLHVSNTELIMTVHVIHVSRQTRLKAIFVDVAKISFSVNRRIKEDITKGN